MKDFNVKIFQQAYLVEAQSLFIPFRHRVNDLSFTNFQTIITFIKEFVFFIPNAIKRTFFVRDFNNKVEFLSNVKIDLQFDNPLTIKHCAKKMRQLNSLYSVHLLMAKYYGYDKANSIESKIKNAIMGIQFLINSHINFIENERKNHILNSPQENLLPLSKKEGEGEVYTRDDELDKRSSQESMPSMRRETQIKMHQVEVKPPLSFMNPSNQLWGRVKKWSGINNLQDGMIHIREGKYRTGLKELAFGSLRIALIASTIGLAKHILNHYQNQSTQPVFPQSPVDQSKIGPNVQENNSTLPPFFSDNPVSGGGHPLPGIDIPVVNPGSDSPPKDELPKEEVSSHFSCIVDDAAPPCVQKSQIQSESFNSKRGERKITLITAYDEGIKDYAQYVIPNQRAYAAKQGYDYIEYYGNLTGEQRAPYWSKIVAIYDQLQKTKDGEWIVWGDASVLFTNTEKNFEQIIDKYGVDKDLILTTDPQLPINNAVFLVKNTPWTKGWIKKVWERSDLAIGGQGNCWMWGQPFCHYEQQAMTELWEIDVDVQAHTTIIPNKEMNAFYRYSHYDPYRRMAQTYDRDPEASKWTSGDFVCKVTGMDRDRRLKIIQYVAEHCIDQNCDRVVF